MKFLLSGLLLLASVISANAAGISGGGVTSASVVAAMAGQDVAPAKVTSTTGTFVNINVSSKVVASAFEGDGSGLTGLPSGGVSGSGTTDKLSKWSAATALTDSLASDDGTNFLVDTPDDGGYTGSNLSVTGGNSGGGVAGAIVQTGGDAPGGGPLIYHGATMSVSGGETNSGSAGSISQVAGNVGTHLTGSSLYVTGGDDASFIPGHIIASGGNATAASNADGGYVRLVGGNAGLAGFFGGSIVLDPGTGPAGSGTIDLNGVTKVNSGTNTVYRCTGSTGGTFDGTLSIVQNTGACPSGTWVATSLKLD